MWRPNWEIRFGIGIGIKADKTERRENDRRQNNSGLPMGMQRKVGKYHFQTRKCSSAILKE